MARAKELFEELGGVVYEMESELYGLKFSNHALSQSVNRLQEELEDFRRNEPLDELLKQLKDAKADNEDLRRRLAKAETERAELLDQRTLWAAKHG